MTADAANPELADLMHRINHRLRRRWGARLAPHGLSPHYFRALAAISHATTDDDAVHGLKLREIADRLRIAPRSATEVIDGLEDRDLVQRVPHPRDRRATLVVLTEAGRELYAQLREERQRSSHDFFAVLDAQDQTELGRILTKLIAAHPRGDHDA